MKQHDSLNCEQLTVLREMFINLRELVIEVKMFALRRRLSYEDARRLIEPILLIRGLLAEMRAGGGIAFGDETPTLSELEDAFLSVEGVVKENRNERMRGK